MAAAATSSFAHDDAGRATRLAAAFAVSLVCHALVLVAVRGWRLASHPERPLMVTLVASGGGDAGAPLGDAPVADGRPAAAPAPPVSEPGPPPAAIERVPDTKRVVPLAPARIAARVAAVTPRAADATVTDAALARATGAAKGDVGESGSAASHIVDDGGEAGRAAGAAGDGAGGSAAGDDRGAGAGRGASDGTGGGADGLRAFCASCPAPAYPGRARRQGWQGTVDVELVIGLGGVVEAARVGRSSGYPTLDAVALDVARESRFTVPSGGAGLRGELRYRFVLDGATAER